MASISKTSMIVIYTMFVVVIISLLLIIHLRSIYASDTGEMKRRIDNEKTAIKYAIIMYCGDTGENIPKWESQDIPTWWHSYYGSSSDKMIYCYEVNCKYVGHDIDSIINAEDMILLVDCKVVR